MMEPNLFASLRPPLLQNLVPIPPNWAKTPFTTTSFLSLSLLFGLSRFEWQHSLECFNLL